MTVSAKPLSFKSPAAYTIEQLHYSIIEGGLGATYLMVWFAGNTLLLSNKDPWCPCYIS